jgi:hypothetical protein
MIRLCPKCCKRCAYHKISEFREPADKHSVYTVDCVENNFNQGLFTVTQKFQFYFLSCMGLYLAARVQ